MPRSQNSSAGSSLLVRVAAGFVLSLSMIICGLQVLVAITPVTPADKTDSSNPAPAQSVPTPALFIGPLLTLAAGVAFAGLLEGIARLLSQPAGVAGPAPVVNTERLTAAVLQLQGSLPPLFDELRLTLQPPTPAPDPALAAPAAAGEMTTDGYLDRMVKLLEEMKDLSMLDDAQRQQRRKQVMDRRKLSRLEDAGRLIHHQEWAQADALLHLLESLHPGDPEVLARRNELDDARTMVQSVEWDKLGGQVEDLMALSNYEEAVHITSHFLDQFPGHPDCQALLQRVQRERSTYLEGHATVLYDQIKSAVENRQWRTALEGIQQFLENFPEHPRADKIRVQVRPIQKNAEIEERHELEVRIRELVTARQYTEAADMAEDLLQRFPESTQAAHLAEILPKLRERATAEASGNVFLG
jgi:TolA-binding protein